MRRIDDMVDAAGRHFAAVAAAHGDAPASARLAVENSYRSRVALRRPPLHQLSRLGPQRKQAFGLHRDQALEPERGPSVFGHDLLRFGVWAAATISSRSSAAVQYFRWRDSQLSIGASASSRTRT